jgi:hypothetical protein
MHCSDVRNWLAGVRPLAAAQTESYVSDGILDTVSHEGADRRAGFIAFVSAGL